MKGFFNELHAHCFHFPEFDRKVCRFLGQNIFYCWQRRCWQRTVSSFLDRLCVISLFPSSTIYVETSLEISALTGLYFFIRRFLATFLAQYLTK